MTASIVKLAPVLVLVAFTLEGCMMADIPWSAKIVIGEKCHERVEELSEKALAKDLKVGACNAFDQDKLAEFGVDDCKEVLHQVLHFLSSVECEATAAGMAWYACSNESLSSEPEGCQSAIDTTVSDFKPTPPDMLDASDKKCAAAAMGLFVACSEVTKGMESKKDFGKWSEETCTEVTDPKKMGALGVKNKDCKDYFQKRVVDIGTIACIISSFYRQDVPENPCDVTSKYIQQSAKDFGKEIKSKTLEELENHLEEVLDPEGRLRLFQTLRAGQWPRRLRHWPRATVAASALFAWALVVLASVACCMRRSRRQLSTEEEVSPLQHEMLPVA